MKEPDQRRAARENTQAAPVMMPPRREKGNANASHVNDASISDVVDKSSFPSTWPESSFYGADASALDGTFVSIRDLNEEDDVPSVGGGYDEGDGRDFVGGARYGSTLWVDLAGWALGEVGWTDIRRPPS